MLNWELGAWLIIPMAPTSNSNSTHHNNYDNNTNTDKVTAAAMNSNFPGIAGRCREESSVTERAVNPNEHRGVKMSLWPGLVFAEWEAPRAGSLVRDFTEDFKRVGGGGHGEGSDRQGAGYNASAALSEFARRATRARQRVPRSRRYRFTFQRTMLAHKQAITQKVRPEGAAVARSSLTFSRRVEVI